MQVENTVNEWIELYTDFVSVSAVNHPDAVCISLVLERVKLTVRK